MSPIRTSTPTWLYHGARLAIVALLGLLFCFPHTVDSGELTVATWNIRRLASYNRTARMLAAIARVLQHYDLVAIQELHDPYVLHRLITLLRHHHGRRYGFLLSAPVGSYHYYYTRRGRMPRGHYERYAFLYDRQHVRPLSKGHLYSDPHDYFYRHPFWARFRAGHCDFVLITTHIIYSAARWVKIREMRGLRHLYHVLRQRYPYENDLIFLGDFNLEASDWHAWRALTALPDMQLLFHPPFKSLISDRHLYDNILLQPGHVREWTGEYGVDYFDRRLFHGHVRQARRWCSDHRPLWCVLNTDYDDD